MVIGRNQPHDRTRDVSDHLLLLLLDRNRFLSLGDNGVFRLVVADTVVNLVGVKRFLFPCLLRLVVLGCSDDDVASTRNCLVLRCRRLTNDVKEVLVVDGINDGRNSICSTEHLAPRDLLLGVGDIRGRIYASDLYLGRLYTASQTQNSERLGNEVPKRKGKVVTRTRRGVSSLTPPKTWSKSQKPPNPEHAPRLRGWRTP